MLFNKESSNISRKIAFNLIGFSQRAHRQCIHIYVMYMNVCEKCNHKLCRAIAMAERVRETYSLQPVTAAFQFE